MSYASEFSGEWAPPPEILKLTDPKLDGVDDMSWHNDVCPSFGVGCTHLGEDVCLRLWSDHPNPELREMSPTPRYHVSFTGYKSQEGNILATDDVAEAIFCFRKSRLVIDTKYEILALIEKQVVPPHVASFSQLHDFVDANVLGGAEKLIEWVGLDDACTILNAVQIEVNAWLAAGRPAKPWKLQEQPGPHWKLLRYTPPKPPANSTLYAIDDGEDGDRVQVDLLYGPENVDLRELNLEWLRGPGSAMFTSRVDRACKFAAWLVAEKGFTKGPEPKEWSFGDSLEEFDEEAGALPDSESDDSWDDDDDFDFEDDDDDE
jgi:hypothetical protein